MGDEHYMQPYFSGYMCDSQRLGWINDSYGLDYNTWKYNGWDDACNPQQPMGGLVATVIASAFSTATLVRSAVSSPFPTSPFLDWALLWSAEVIPQLKVMCADAEEAQGVSFNATTIPTLFGPYVGLNVGSFFNTAVPDRAKTLIHEAMHVAGGLDHVAGGAKDTFWGEYGSAFTMSLVWLSQYVQSGINAPIGLQCDMEDAVNARLVNSFVTDPGWRLTKENTDCNAPDNDWPVAGGG